MLGIGLKTKNLNTLFISAKSFYYFFFFLKSAYIIVIVVFVFLNTVILRMLESLGQDAKTPFDRTGLAYQLHVYSLRCS